jgi:hypothetical protein
VTLARAGPQPCAPASTPPWGVALATSCSTGCWLACIGTKTSCCACSTIPTSRCAINGSENNIHACVTKRKVSGGTMSTTGRTARDALLGLMKTCRKLGVSFFGYLGDRLHVPGAVTVPPLPDLVRQTATIPYPDRPAICPVTASRDLIWPVPCTFIIGRL